MAKVAQIVNGQMQFVPVPGSPGAWHRADCDCDASTEPEPAPIDPDDDFEQAVYDIKNEEARLLVKKHRDYGPLNIAKAPGGPLNGLAVRLHDKVSRLWNLKGAGRDEVFKQGEYESLEDTGLDIANYGTITTMVVRGLWPSE